MPAWFDDTTEGRREPSEWEPEPLHLPLEIPRGPERHDDAPAEHVSRVIVIDLA